LDAALHRAKPFRNWKPRQEYEQEYDYEYEARISPCNVYCVVYTTHMTADFGDYLRKRRLEKQAADATFSVRQLAARVGIEPSYLSKIERGQQPPPSEQTITALAKELEEDPDVMLALAGKVSSDLLAIVRKRPKLFGELIRQLKNMPNHAVLRLVREVRDGEW